MTPDEAAWADELRKVLGYLLLPSLSRVQGMAGLFR